MEFAENRKRLAPGSRKDRDPSAAKNNASFGKTRLSPLFWIKADC
jgi:hypothetical protein